MAPHIALHEIGRPLREPPAVVCEAQETRTPSYLAVNPEGKVPTLVIDGRPLTEVAAILLYLARRFPEAGLLPSTISKRRRRPCRGCPSSPRPSIRRGVKAWSMPATCTAVADRRLGSVEWALGQRTRSPTSISSACIGAFATRSNPRAGGLPQPRGPLRADDGTACRARRSRSRPRSVTRCRDKRPLSSRAQRGTFRQQERSLAALGMTGCRADDGASLRLQQQLARRRGGLRGRRCISAASAQRERRPRWAPSASPRQCRPST